MSVATEQSATHSSVWSRVAGGVFVILAMASYYALFFFPPRLLGSTDPDRYYHLGLSRLISHQGLLRTLPQAEDLGWGRYFPDKEFLFHVLTGTADWINGSMGVLLLVPLLGIGIAACLYTEICRVVRPFAAAVLAAAVPLLTVRFLFRLTLLRPHMLAVLFFCLLLLAVLRKRPKLAALAAAGFALSYHAFYIVVLVACVAWLFRRKFGPDGGNCWLWTLAGLVVGIVVNPYFPANIVMSWLHLQLALGINPPPGADTPMEMASHGWKGFLLIYGFVPASLIAAALAMKFRPVGDRPKIAGLETAGSETAGFWFLFVLTLLLTVLAIKSDRAMEYGVPAGILMVGYCARVTGFRWWIPFNLVLLLACQGYVARIFYLENWNAPPKANFDLYAAAISTLPADAAGKKVFNCEWWSGAYLLHERPDVRFVDVLDPAFLWRASPEKYLAQLGLSKGAFPDPHAILRDAFKADADSPDECRYRAFRATSR
jgi:hypothetical protein